MSFMLMLSKQAYNKFKKKKKKKKKISRRHFVIFFVFSPENMIWHFMQTVSSEDYLREMSNRTFGENKK